MKCDKSLAGVLHDSHWHTVMAGNIVVAGGMCEGYPEGAGETLEEARANLAKQARAEAARFDRQAELAVEAAAYHRERAMRIERGE